MIVGVAPYRFDYPMSINSLFSLVLPHKCSPPTDWSCSNLNCVALQPMLPDITMALPPATPSSWVPSKASPPTVAHAQSNMSWSICRSDSDITNVACSNQCHSLNCNTCNWSVHRPVNVGLWHSFDCQHCVLNSIQCHSPNSSYVCVSSTPFSPLIRCSLPTDRRCSDLNYICSCDQCHPMSHIPHNAQQLFLPTTTTLLLSAQQGNPKPHLNWCLALSTPVMITSHAQIRVLMDLPIWDFDTPLRNTFNASLWPTSLIKLDVPPFVNTCNMTSTDSELPHQNLMLNSISNLLPILVMVKYESKYPYATNVTQCGGSCNVC